MFPLSTSRTLAENNVVSDRFTTESLPKIYSIETVSAVRFGPDIELVLKRVVPSYIWNLYRLSVPISAQLKSETDSVQFTSPPVGTVSKKVLFFKVHDALLSVLTKRSQVMLSCWVSEI